MDFHHGMIVRTHQERVYQALTQAGHLSVWMAAPVSVEPPGLIEIGSIITFDYSQGQDPGRSLIARVRELIPGKLIRWEMERTVWQMPSGAPQAILWTLNDYAGSTLVDVRVGAWPGDDETYASVSYKLASFMMRLKIYLGDLREIEDMLETITQPRESRKEPATAPNAADNHPPRAR